MRIHLSSNLPPLTGVRGLAALWTWIYHAWLVAGNRPIRIESLNINLTPLFSQGWVGVDLFFVLSGFVLAWPFLGAAARSFVYGEFIRRRSLRVIPAYYFQLLLLLCAGAIGFVWDLPSFDSSLFHLLLTHNLREAWTFYAPWWTLPIEWYFYLVFPLLLAALLKRPGGSLILLLTAAIAWRAGSFFWLEATVAEATVGSKVWLMHQLPGRIDQFFVGIVAALLTHRLRSTLGTDFRARLSNYLVVGGAGLLILWLYVLAWSFAGYWQGEYGLAFYWNSVAALILGCFLVGLALEGRLAGRLFANRGMLWLGEISYSLYLWHFAVLVLLVELGVFIHFGGERLFLWVIAFSLPTMIAVAALSWWVAERPFLRYRQAPTGRAHGFGKIIAFPWPYMALAGALLLGLSWAMRAYWTPAHEHLASCTQRSAIDTPTRLSATTPSVTLAGWAYDWNPQDRLRRMVVLANGVEVASAPINQKRQDVVDALPHCRVGQPGFSVAIDTRRVPGGEAVLVVHAERRSGARFEIGRLTQEFTQAIHAIDSAPSPVWNGINLFSGWSWHPAGPVVVRWRNVDTDSVLWEGVANRVRQDVADAFPAWQGVEKSGFEFEAEMSKLPRGRYATSLEFVAANGQTSRAQGPLVENELPIGKVIAIGAQRLVDPKSIQLNAWAFSESGIADATLETESGQVIAALPLLRRQAPLAALADPRFPSRRTGDKTAGRLGALFQGSIDGAKIPSGLHRLLVRVRDVQGRSALLPGPLVAKNEALPLRSCQGDKFRVYLVADMEFIRRGIPMLQELREMAESGCVEFGLQMRVEYLRTTRGKAADFAFDADFPEKLRRWHGKEMLGVSLKTALAQANTFAVPVRLTLDGGVWADSRFPLPDYDIADWLEADELNVQWNQHNRSEADDALSGLAGATDNPQLARMLSLNHYNQPFLAYKKRNLQAAVRLIVAYNREHPHRPASINLDPDQYINPWFYLTQWYDYNPRTLRQFREWLTQTGAYADGGDLAAFRSAKKLSLADLNRMAKASWTSIDAIDPPRKTPDYSDPWHQRWTAFKRHLVARHYADLADWAVEAGLPADLIYTGQTFIQSDVAVTEDDTATGWTDEAGVSLQGAKPTHGHLGAILYGPASRNEGKVRSGHSLLDNIAAVDRRWAVVEMHPATIARPNTLPTHGDAYRTMQSIYNHGASSMTLMWGSWAGDQALHPEAFRAYDVLDQSAWETQLLLWLRAIADLPQGSILWTFGNAYHRSDDGFLALPGSKVKAQNGTLHLTGEGDKTPPKSGFLRGKIGQTIGTNSSLRLRTSSFSRAEVHLFFATGESARISLEKMENGFSEAALARYAGKILDRFAIIFDEKTVAVDSVALVQHLGKNNE